MTSRRNATPETVVRRATLADAAALASLEVVFPAEDRSTAADMRRLFAGNSAVFTIDHEGAPAAAAIVLYRRGARVARLYSLGVAIHARGRGYAHLMIDAAVADASARGCDRLRLEVRASNRDAVRLYEDAGFSSYEVKSGFYPDGEDAVLMMKFLHGTNDRQVAAAR